MNLLSNIKQDWIFNFFSGLQKYIIVFGKQGVSLRTRILLGMLVKYEDLADLLHFSDVPLPKPQKALGPHGPAKLFISFYVRKNCYIDLKTFA